MNYKTRSKRPNRRPFLKFPLAFANSLSPGLPMCLWGLDNGSDMSEETCAPRCSGRLRFTGFLRQAPNYGSQREGRRHFLRLFSVDDLHPGSTGTCRAQRDSGWVYLCLPIWRCTDRSAQALQGIQYRARKCSCAQEPRRHACDHFCSDSVMMRNNGVRAVDYLKVRHPT